MSGCIYLLQVKSIKSNAHMLSNSINHTIFLRRTEVTSDYEVASIYFSAEILRCETNVTVYVSQKNL